MRIWRTPTGELARKIIEYLLSLFAVEFSGDGQWLAIAGADRSTYIWDARGSKLARTLTGGRLDVIRQASRVRAP